MSELIQTDLFGNVIIKKSEDVYESKSKPKDISDTITTEYIIEVVCKDEKDIGLIGRPSGRDQGNYQKVSQAHQSGKTSKSTHRVSSLIEV